MYTTDIRIVIAAATEGELDWQVRLVRATYARMIAGLVDADQMYIDEADGLIGRATHDGTCAACLTGRPCASIWALW